MNRIQALLSLLVVFVLALGGAGCGGGDGSQDASETMAMGEDGPLFNPDSEEFQKQAPATFQVEFETSAGDFTVDVVRDWAPHGADRFYNLVRLGFYNDCRFFRVVPGFVAQFGMNGDPDIQQIWSGAGMPDDPVKQSNKPGYITYAKTNQPNSRSTQLFINLRDNSQLDGMGFAPFGRVTKGMEVVDKLYDSYGDGPPSGSGPNQAQIMTEGNAYLTTKFPKLDYIKKASIVQ
jgi:peptidyl-prolyl cis-trans isomerase A (cyclophilin A)